MNNAALDSARCMMSFVRIAVKRHKSLSNPMEVDPYTAGNAIRNIGDIKKI